MEIVTEITQRNQYKPPCHCASYVRMRETVPFCDDPKSAYYLRCPAGECEHFDGQPREALLKQREQERTENAWIDLVTTTAELNGLRKQRANADEHQQV